VISNTGEVRISHNQITNCGLSNKVTPPAVTYADGGTDLTINHNNYTGNTTNLQYFIDTPIATATVGGNTTNTMLPNKVGP
jgi:hypothetical protein